MAELIWIIRVVPIRDGVADKDDGMLRRITADPNSMLPEIDHTFVHRGEEFVVDDVIWNYETSEILVQIVPAAESTVASKKVVVEDPIRDDDDDDEDG